MAEDLSHRERGRLDFHLPTFADAMPNCGIWIEDEHAIDPDEVDDTNLECME